MVSLYLDSNFLLSFIYLLELDSKGLRGKCLGRCGGNISRSDRVHLTEDVQDMEIATLRDDSWTRVGGRILGMVNLTVNHVNADVGLKEIFSSRNILMAANKTSR